MNEVMSEIFAEYDDGDFLLCKDVAETLQEHYPDMFWRVYSKNSVVFIDSAIVADNPKNRGLRMVIHKKNIMHDAKVRKEKVVRMGGEYLERAGLPRRGWHGEKTGVLER